MLVGGGSVINGAILSSLLPTRGFYAQAGVLAVGSCLGLSVLSVERALASTPPSWCMKSHVGLLMVCNVNHNSRGGGGGSGKFDMVFLL